jgi:hypothetical protein
MYVQGLGNLSEAKEALDQCIAVSAAAATSATDLLQADAHDKLAQLYRAQGQPEEAYREEAEALRLKKNLGIQVCLRMYVCAYTCKVGCMQMSQSVRVYIYM